MTDKSVLVIDTPENCYECPLVNYKHCNANYFVRRNHGGNIPYNFSNEYIHEQGRQTWCPLRPLPQKIDLEKQDEIDFETSIDEPYLADKIIESQGYKRTGATSDIYISWNACIDEILGDCDEE